MMDPGLIGLLGVAGMLALILLGGMSPGLAMLLAGFCGMAALNPPATFAALVNGTTGPEVWGVFSNYGFTVIPLFVPTTSTVTRRFLARPAAVVLSATGCVSPLPSV